MKLLLHVCCGPCAIHPLAVLCAEARVSGLYYNPNVHPSAEYDQRLRGAREVCRRQGVELSERPYDMPGFFNAVRAPFSPSQRCGACWRLRLSVTARMAREGGYDAFSTTLLVSPYQDHDQLKRTGDEIALNEKVPFLYRDFRPGFRAAQDTARAEGIYRQKYCGCIFSEYERAARRSLAAQNG